ncbi:Gfo/Idh/MocA family protein [Paenibacillus lignilyticus]|uniref:Gfo/Idh/MocA family oxidoreductase n=1 Tax=Paenibacillus lignilyticus TaxID=1172615 RepID=A0ABS5C9E3_9BACL|nr:Gfo/Idh/MocA family oxidoreductase [Paenibacillus lignilyticus]MBP3962553.1 Gfo/Idh/MocA family oxidoreductase [Paenibacillus lignilyticus]
MGAKPVRLAVVGGNRGTSFKLSLAALSDKISLTAICDLNEAVLKSWKEQYPDIQTYQNYGEMLQNPSIDAVLIASPMLMHARQSIDALKAGKHVLSEVIAAHTLDEAFELVETVEKTGLVYMMAENYCYTRANLAVKNMAEKGMFGEITYMEGAYIHELRHILHNSDQTLNWRGRLHKDYNGMNYPTHSLGPVAQWIAINKQNGDELESMATFVSKSRALRNYCSEQFGQDHPGAQDGFWQQGDSAVTVLRTKQNVMITLRVDWSSPRPHQTKHYVLQGTEGAYVSGRYQGEDDLIWLRDRSPSSTDIWHDNGELQTTWRTLSSYQPEYDHPLWNKWAEQASQARHGGGDFFVLEEFVSVILGEREPSIDVYDAVTWSSVFPLSLQSVAENGKVMTFPKLNKRQEA